MSKSLNAISLSASLVLVLTSAPFAFAAASGKPSDSFRFQHHRTGSQTLNIDIQSLTSKDASGAEAFTVTYRRTPARESEKDFSTSETINEMTIHLALDPLTQGADPVSKWSADQDCIGRETWLVQIRDEPSKSICLQDDKIKKLNQFETTIKLLLTK